MNPDEIKVALGQVFETHRYDTVSQDSGMQCICGSDSRFVQRFGHRVDGTWETFGEHQADVAIYWLHLWGR
jgi:hypothetical protein